MTDRKAPAKPPLKPTLSLAASPVIKSAAANLQVGDPAPMFICPSNVNPKFDFSTTAGRFLVLSFYGSTRQAVGKGLIDTFVAASETFADPDFYFFGVASDATDPNKEAFRNLPPGMDIFWDDDGQVSALYRLGAADGGNASGYQPVTFLLDPSMRVIGIFATNDGPMQANSVLQVLKRLPKLGPPRPAQMQAPVLILPTYSNATSAAA